MGSGSHIREIERSTTELCSLPARSTGLFLRCQVFDTALVRSGERPHRGREAATLGQDRPLNPGGYAKVRQLFYRRCVRLRHETEALATQCRTDSVEGVDSVLCFLSRAHFFDPEMPSSERVDLLMSLPIQLVQNVVCDLHLEPHLFLLGWTRVITVSSCRHLRRPPARRREQLPQGEAEHEKGFTCGRLGNGPARFGPHTR